MVHAEGGQEFGRDDGAALRVTPVSEERQFPEHEAVVDLAHPQEQGGGVQGRNRFGALGEGVAHGLFDAGQVFVVAGAAAGNFHLLVRHQGAVEQCDLLVPQVAPPQQPLGEDMLVGPASGKVDPAQEASVLGERLVAVPLVEEPWYLVLNVLIVGL
ncbi:hypothetical protein ACFWUZ_02450 [Streptomyces sp. NPDC058646]|uniref:hypothetical protein n=1 Tax=Streptomyces sp. NPDC058646 TaxID=3346574 RepID=UPI00365C23DC